MALVTPIQQGLSRVWTSDRTLTASALLMLVALAAFLVGLVIDSRVITGVPAWLKPAKFAVSTAIYMFTLAWVFTYLGEWPRLRTLVGRGTAAIFIVEVAIIALQAWRGTTSHFNFSTPLNSALFAVMGSAIVVQTILSAFVAVALWRQRFQDRALGWALRLGMVITIAGGSTGGLMTRPTDAQLEQMKTTHRPSTVIGAHTVGAPDGGAGLPGTGWSVQHGDIRVGHFIGLHALQALPALSVLLLYLGWNERQRTRMIIAASASYAGLFVLVLRQALRGQSIANPDMATVVTFGLWLAVSLVIVAAAARTSVSPLRAAAF